MIFTVLLAILVILLLIYRLYQQKELFSQLTWWERIYSTFLYVGLFVGMVYGYSVVKKWMRNIVHFEIIEFLVLLVYTGIAVWIIATILEKLLPKKIIEAIIKK